MNVSFNATEPILRPLPLMQLFYRWHVDLCSIGRTTPRGNLYCMVCIEAWSKYAVMIPIPDKTSLETSYAFLQHVLARFGAPAEVVTDGGGEFMSYFDKMLQDALIDHRRTSSNHPQANGLAERCVRTLKHGLKKQVRLLNQPDYDGFMYDDEDAKNPKPVIPWDLYVPWIALGYNASKQASTGFSPFYMIHARHATVPPAVQEKFKEPLDFSNGNDMERLTDTLLERAKEARRVSLIAGDNLLIAQHRDTKRYAEIRSGVYLPKVRRFEIGDYVYVKRRSADVIVPTLDMPARPEILRIIEIRPKGVLILQGKDLTTIAENRVNCTPCHLPIVEADEAQGEPVYQHTPCSRCKQVDKPELMVICSSCSQRYHIHCLQPQLSSVPKLRYWTCKACQKRKSDETLVERDQEKLPSTAGAGRQGPQEEPVIASSPRAKNSDQVPPLPTRRGRPPKSAKITKVTESSGEEDEEIDLSSPLEGLTTSQLENLHQGLSGQRVLLQHVDPESGIRLPELWTLEYKGKRHRPKCFIARYKDKKPLNLTLEEVQMTLVPINYEPPSPVDRDRIGGDQDLLEIDTVIAKKTTPGGRKTLYQVLYKGQPDNFRNNQNWVSEHELDQETLEAFERDQRSQRRLASSTIRTLLQQEPKMKEASGTDRPERVRKESSRLKGYHVSMVTHDCKDRGPVMDFDLKQSTGVLEALETLMPSPNGWTKGHATKLANQLVGGRRFLQPQGSYTPGRPQRIATTEQEIQGLLDVIDFSLLPSIVDTFSGHGTIQRVFKQHGLRVICNDIDNEMEADYHLDALQHSTYQSIKDSYGLDAVVISPTFAFLDLALPLAVLHAEQLVCCHVPGHYFTCAPRARFEWMSRLQHEGRLAVIAGLPVGPSHRQCLWFLIFRSAALKKLLYRPGREQYLGFHFLTHTSSHSHGV